MTRQEIVVAKSIKDCILPKLQEIQRDLFLDEHFSFSIEPGTFKKCVSVFIHVTKSADSSLSENSLCLGSFSFTTYLHDEQEQRAKNEKALRGIQHFIKNWQERLG